VKTPIETLARDLDFPEGPAFAPDGSLWFVDLGARSLVRFAEGEVTHYPAQGVPNGAAFDDKGRLLFCDAERNAIRRFEPGTQVWETVAESPQGEPLRSPNDLAFDARELALVAGGEALVVAETHRHRLWRGAWDAAAGRWQGPEPWAEVGGPVGPDGMALGADGRLYVAVFGSGQIRVVDERGKVAERFDLPGANPTNAAFDPSGRLGLVVTETERGELLSLPELGPGAMLFRGG
jgi:gluconolactonase